MYLCCPDDYNNYCGHDSSIQFEYSIKKKKKNPWLPVLVRVTGKKMEVVIPRTRIHETQY